MEAELNKLLITASDVSDDMEAQMSFSHQYALAAGEDVESSSRDWAAITAGIASRVDMSNENIPVYTDLAKY